MLPWGVGAEAVDLLLAASRLWPGYMQVSSSLELSVVPTMVKATSGAAGDGAWSIRASSWGRRLSDSLRMRLPPKGSRFSGISVLVWSKDDSLQSPPARWFRASRT